MKNLVITLITALLSASTLAAPVNLSHIGKDAKWCMHLDLSKTRQTVTGKMVALEIFKKQVAKDALAKLENYAGPGAFDKIQSLTAYGYSEERQQGILLLTGKLDQAKITSTAIDKGFEKSKLDGAVVFEKPDKDRRGFALADEELIVIASNKKLLLIALDILNDKLPNAGTDQFAALTNWSKDTFFTVELTDAAPIKKTNPENQMLNAIDQLSFSAGEADGSLDLNMHITSADQEKAKFLMQAAQGAVAFAMFKSSEMPQFASILRNLQITSRNRTVHVNLNHPAEELLKLAAMHIQLNKQKDGLEIEAKMEVSDSN